MSNDNTRFRSRDTYNNHKKQFLDKKDVGSQKYFREKKINEQKNPVLPGLKPVLELLESDAGKIEHVYIRKGRTPKDSNKILDLCRENGIRFSMVDDAMLARLCEERDGQSSQYSFQSSYHVSQHQSQFQPQHQPQHQGIVATLRAMSYVNVEDLFEKAFDAPLPLIIALDQVLDPGNVGTLVRTLYALGVAGLIVPRHNSAYLGAGAQRSSAGALEKLPIAEVVNLARTVELAGKSGFTTYAAELDGMNALASHTKHAFNEESDFKIKNENSSILELPALLVLGSEEKGVRQGILKHCAHKLTIPFLREFDSLNVAQAGAILTSCFLRAHKF